MHRWKMINDLRENANIDASGIVKVYVAGVR